MLENYIKEQPELLTSLVPVRVFDNAPEIAKRMASASALAGVGPMAAVAGAISELIGERLNGSVVVENGGDIYARSSEPVSIAIFAGNSPLSRKYAFKVKSSETPVGICTSSGTVGHSLSFGRSDATTIIADSATLADAVATAAGNMVKNENCIQPALSFAMSIPGVRGAVIIVQGKIGLIGRVPEITELGHERMSLC